MAKLSDSTRTIADQFPLLATIIGLVGVVYIATLLFGAIKALMGAFVIPGVKLSRYGGRGSWAVVTGASDGLGKEFARQLGKKGFNVFVISRTESKLQSVALEIERSFNVETKTLAMDFAKDDDEDYAQIADIVKGLEIAILVNNVGKSHDMPVPFVQTTKQEMTDIVKINCLGTLKVTQIITPKLISRKRGLIVTLGSFGGLLPTPLLATYSGSKAFLQQWSTCLGAELKPHGVDVELVLSYMVTTAMSKVRKPSLLVATPATLVSSALSKIGRSGGPDNYPFTCTPFWSHALFQYVAEGFLGAKSFLMLGINKNMHEKIRAAALRKAARGAKKAS